MTVRENSDELTLRAEEVGTLKTYINVNHVEEERWVSPWFHTFWVNASRVIPPLTIPNVKNPSVLILSLKEKRNKIKQKNKKKRNKEKRTDRKNQKKKRIKTGAVFPYF